MSLLEIDQLSVAFDTEGDTVTVVDSVGFEVETGETLGIVGESGCGKSVTALSIMGLLPKPSGRVQGGDIRFRGESLPSLPPERMRTIRGNRIAMIFQEPMTALNPVHRVGRQLAETFALHQGDLPPTRRSTGARWDSWSRWAFPPPSSVCANTRTNFPAGCASA